MCHVFTIGGASYWSIVVSCLRAYFKRNTYIDVLLHIPLGNADVTRKSKKTMVHQSQVLLKFCWILVQNTNHVICT